MFRTAAIAAIAFTTACSNAPANADAAADAIADAPLACVGIDAGACSMPAPSYSKDVAPLIGRACNATCHAPGVGPWPFTDHKSVADWSNAILVDLEACTMPPPAEGGIATLTDQERAMLIEWIACGSPNN